MIALRDWIVSQNCHHVAMESTGIYWMPIYEILEDEGFHVNADFGNDCAGSYCTYSIDAVQLLNL